VPAYYFTILHILLPVLLILGYPSRASIRKPELLSSAKPHRSAAKRKAVKAQIQNIKKIVAVFFLRWLSFARILFSLSNDCGFL
jgi:hypothetical protein